MSDELQQRLWRELNRLCKWRSILAGWQLGTRPKTDPETQAVRDQREILLLLRVELNALTNLLITKGTITKDEYFAQQLQEIQHMHKSLERRFPGFKATDDGMKVTLPEAAETTKGWKP